ncbi:acetyl-CoA synthetase-like protein [Xylariaceae sp. FL0662B]|nr:acetyl-CoA synthetase-like protein [Xylariaceae sp. FL0662B]
MGRPWQSLALGALRGRYSSGCGPSRWDLSGRRARSPKVVRAGQLLAWNQGFQRRGVATSDLSYAEGPREPPLLPHTIPEHFASIVSPRGDHPAVISRSPTVIDIAPPPTSSIDTTPHTTTLTYEGLDSLSNTLARSLQSLGVKKGDRVAISLGNGCEYAALIYALYKLGAVLVPLNPTFNANQLTGALSHLGVEVLIIGAVTDLAYKPCRGRSNLELLSALIPDLGSSKVESPTIPTLKSVILLDNTQSHPNVSFPLQDLRALTPYTTLLSSSNRPVVPDSPLSAADTINIQFTSGTTSMPKAAMLTHTNILNNGYLIASHMGLTPDDRIVCPPPLFHCFGNVLGLMITATTGATLIFPSPAFDPAASLHAVAEHRATGLHGVATMFVAELELLANPGFAAQLSADAFSRLRTGIAAGSSVPQSLMERIFGSLGMRDLVICYGMTETAPVSCMTAPDDALEKRTRTVGRPLAHTAVKIVDPADRATTLPRGRRGELAAAGYLIMQGYYGDAERTRADRHDVDGNGDGSGVVWMHSGDEACMDEDGFIEITGRIKDLVIRGGENIHPLEIENCLFQHPLVREASVVGVPDDRYGEVVGAFVVPHVGVRAVEEVGKGEEVDAGEGQGEHGVLSKEHVREWVRKHLSAHLVPKHVFWIDEYPKTASGKIQKFKLRELASELIAP